MIFALLEVLVAESKVVLVITSSLSLWPTLSDFSAVKSDLAGAVSVSSLSSSDKISTISRDGIVAVFVAAASVCDPTLSSSSRMDHCG